MKKIVFTLLLALGALAGFSQQGAHVPDFSILKSMAEAKKYLNASNAEYDPSKAFAIYNDLAHKKYPPAMNSLAVMYKTGLGAKQNTQEAINWFTEAAHAGYGNSWYNLGLMYKNGDVVSQEDKKAFDCFDKGTLVNNGLCWYGKGYMLYKGLGCKQDYTQAYQCFEKGVKRRDEGSMYMLGLCFRNGYGVQINTDSAKYWLTLAAKRNDKRAIEELADPNPENVDLKSVPDLLPTTQKVDLKTGFKKVKHHVNKNDIAGEYNGFVIKFDWSGKHIISQTGLKLKLECNDKVLLGTWTESGQQEVSLSAELTDTAVVFNNTAGPVKDHYHKSTPLAVEFKDSKLNLVRSNDTTFLAGTISLYSPRWHEPEKPEFIMLFRSEKDKSVNSVSPLAKDDSLHFVAYPNPFHSNLNLRYRLLKEAKVVVWVSEILTGHVVYQSKSRTLLPGDYIDPITVAASPGNYVVTIEYGDKVKSAIIYKQ